MSCPVPCLDILYYFIFCTQQYTRYNGLATIRIFVADPQCTLCVTILMEWVMQLMGLWCNGFSFRSIDTFMTCRFMGSIHKQFKLSPYYIICPFQVYINIHVCMCVCVRVCVPQGSILSPLLYLLYANNIGGACDGKICPFADDTILLISSNSGASLFDDANWNIYIPYSWICAIKLSLNVNKAKYMYIISKPYPRRFS